MSAGFSELAANYQLHGQTPPAWAVQRKRGWQDDIGALIHELAPAIENLFAQKRQDKIAEALMTGTAPRATAVTDASGHALSGGGPMDAAGVDQYNAGLGAATSADVFQGSPTERYKLAQIIQKQRDQEQADKLEAIKRNLESEKLQQQVYGYGPNDPGRDTGGGIHVQTPYGKMTANEWSHDPRNPEGIKTRGVEYVDTPYGRMTAGEWAKMTGAPAVEKAKTEQRATLDEEIANTQAEIDAGNVRSGPDWLHLGETYADKLKKLQAQRAGLDTKPQTSTSVAPVNAPGTKLTQSDVDQAGNAASPLPVPEPSPTPAPKPAINKDKTRDVVTRITKDGRKAIFDANTKEFIQYAP